MTLEELIEQCDGKIELVPDGLDLIVTGGGEPLEDDAMNMLKAHKMEILSILYDPIDRRTCLQSAAGLGYPSMNTRSDDGMAAGQAAWERFTALACIRDVRDVLGRLAIMELDRTVVGWISNHRSIDHEAQGNRAMGAGVRAGG